MTPKYVIAQAEKKMEQGILKLYPLDREAWEETCEDFRYFFKSYTKDLLQSDREEIKAEIKNKIKGIGMSSANYREVLDIINNIQKE